MALGLQAPWEVKALDFNAADTLSPKQQLDGLFWALFQTDPLIEVHDHLPPEALAAIPPAPPMNQAVLADLLGKLERVAHLYAIAPEAVVAALGRVV